MMMNLIFAVALALGTSPSENRAAIQKAVGVVGAILLPVAVCAADAERPLVDCVDPMIGAITLEGYGGHGLGKTFPGAATPFGMVQLSPDTITGGDNGSGYSYHHETIEGFSMTERQSR